MNISWCHFSSGLRLLAFLTLSIHAAIPVLSARANEKIWPEGYEIYEDSTSPDARLGVLIPSREQGVEMDDDKIANKLVDLISHGRIAEIKGAHYFAGKNHSGLEVNWASDSKLCVVTYDGRFGFETLTAMEIRNGDCRQVELGRHIQQVLNAAITRQAGDSHSCDGNANAYLRFTADRNILVRATGTTNPKGFDDQHTYCALFQGTFNPTTGKWIRSEAHAVDNIEDLYSAFSDELFEDTTFGDKESKLSSYDNKLNEVYRSVRLLLPKDKFAAIKKEQIAWLKKLGACNSTDQKCDLIAARIKDLRELVW